MKIIEARNVNDAVAQAFPYLIAEGIPEDSRNGKVLVAPGPVCTVYSRPRERVLFSPMRDANPFFHLMESLWMLDGRNDVEFPAYFNKRFYDYSDDGKICHGAYGFRWRRFFNMDQIAHIMMELRTNPNSRRCVLSMWSPIGDLTPVTDLHTNQPIGGLTCKDVPCNTQAYFDCRGGVLNMTVCNRSNDAVWGAYGANVVHFSVLQEYMASIIGVSVGVYRQFSNNFHAYTDIYDEVALNNIAEECRIGDFYTPGLMDSGVKPYNMIPRNDDNSLTEWHDSLQFFMSNPLGTYDYPAEFFNEVAAPMYHAYHVRKAKEGNGMNFIEQMPECDWKFACTAWIARREGGKN